ncbi:ShlB/FhaC/HecB family hemolysin secretion/activation protein [Rodentibacter myodis]|uniref:Hemin-binding protein n=1 Tax=Rodentibacter myodis TaxID=1907939 RepID=A0A1V3JPK1_9PAST|nr:ShlB/FhaC/HecB family hemolysin secretion/activation protein [Rodentibacter myodis]OOF58743.1 hemin-binding protein [Rodentibacter myodis]
MPKIKKPLIFLFSFALPMVVWAGNVPRETQEFNRFQQDAKQQLEQFQQARQQRWVEQHQYQQQQAEQNQADLSQACLPYSGIRFVGFHLIDPTVFAPMQGECLNETRLNQLSRDITAAYLDLGYIYNPFQFEDDHSGVLIMRVMEGKIAKLSGESSRLNFAMLMPNALGNPLNVKDLDQALDQANKMAGSKVSVDVLPAKNGEIELAFVNDEKARFNGFIGADNYASKRVGRWQSRVGVNIDSPLGLSDTLYLSAAHSLKSFSHNFNRSVALFHSVPYGYWTLSTFGSISQFKYQIPLQQTEAQQKGYTWQAAFRADYTFNRGSNSISSAYGQLERLRSKSYFQDALIQLQSPALTTMQWGVNHLQLFPNGSLIADINYERGLKWWNATANQGRDQPEGQFNKWVADLNFNYFHQVFGQTFHQSARLLGQYSQNYLPAIKQADFLGRYAIRGFNDLSQSNEKSIIWQNNLAWLYENENQQISPYVGLDLGIQKASSGDTHSQRALGYAIGLKIIHPRWQTQLEWATGRLFRSNQILQERSVYVNVNVYF